MVAVRCPWDSAPKSRLESIECRTRGVVYRWDWRGCIDSSGGARRCHWRLLRSRDYGRHHQGGQRISRQENLVLARHHRHRGRMDIGCDVRGVVARGDRTSAPLSWALRESRAEKAISNTSACANSARRSLKKFAVIIWIKEEGSDREKRGARDVAFA